MKPVMQTRFGDNGNCYSACLASLFEIPIEDVDAVISPIEKVTDEQWWECVRGFLKARGYGLVHILVPYGKAEFPAPDGYIIVCGMSKRNRAHATIWKDGKLFHDPHPHGEGSPNAGVDSPWTIDIIHPLDVSAFPTPGQWAAARACVELLRRYRKETPLGNQPHMIAGETDAALAAFDAEGGNGPGERPTHAKET